MRKLAAVASIVVLGSGCARDAGLGLPAAPSFRGGLPGGALLDQSQPTADAAAPFTFAIGGPSGQVLAQVVTAGVSGKLRQVDLPVACESGALVLEVRNVGGGAPGATVLASESYAASSFTPFTPGVASFASLRIMPAPVIAAGTSFAIALSNPTGSCGILPGPVGDPYAGGTALVFDPAFGVWNPLSIGNDRDDLAFFTYVQP